ncbi:hypothetical protein [Mycobacterium tuberculosis]|uniref:hypothetical protein n=1 Tax=Mycobacterium tuberculosis TaxID=1773 RepID=UPI001586FB89|nr:hypothetical protein [Mycobacterium tuberculosis]
MNNLSKKECTYCGRVSSSSNGKLKRIGEHFILEDECEQCEGEILCYEIWYDDDQDEATSSWLSTI